MRLLTHRKKTKKMLVGCEIFAIPGVLPLLERKKGKKVWPEGGAGGEEVFFSVKSLSPRAGLGLQEVFPSKKQEPRRLSILHRLNSPLKMTACSLALASINNTIFKSRFSTILENPMWN